MLKILLADDSAAIKKVVQLSLQDFGVELKTVGSGKDVLDVARSFKPDIAFVDVLLPHKTGYEVAAEIKKDPALSKTPIIMLWSSFMEFDEKKFKASGADAKLEKPFEVAGLRAVINQYVPKAGANPLAQHLEFPKPQFGGGTGAFAMPPKTAPPKATPTETQVTKPFTISPPTEDLWSTESISETKEFTMTEIEPQQETMPPPAGETNWGDSEWVRKDLSKFTLTGAGTPDSEIEEAVDMDVPKFDPQKFLHATVGAAHQAPPPEAPAAPSAPPPVMATQSTKPPANYTPSTDVEEYVKEQAREIIEKLVWKLVPDMASQIIREELTRLLEQEK